MNKVVLDHYPAANLPEDVRRGLDEADEVRVTIETFSADRLGPEQQSDKAPVPKPGLFSKYRHLAKARFSSLEEINMIQYPRRVRHSHRTLPLA